jgi:hypothetical protein
MEKSDERRLGRRAPGPTTLDLMRVRALFGPHHIGLQATLEGHPSQSAEDLVAEIVAGQIHMVRLQ